MTDEVDPKQPVVETTKEVAQPTSTEGNAPDDLDALLNEFEKGTIPEKPAEQPTAISDDEIKAYIREEKHRRDREAQERFIAKTKQDIQSAVGFIKEDLDLPVKVSDRVIRGILHALAEDDPRFAQAFANRDANPSAWKRVLKSVKSEVAKEFSVDPEATAGREAVVAAVRSASKTAPEPQKDFDEKEVRSMTASQLLEKFPELKKPF